MKRPRGKGVSCTATTKQGAQCPNQAPRETGLCHIHSERDQPRCKRVNSKTRQQCGNYSNGSGYCNHHDFTRGVSK